MKCMFQLCNCDLCMPHFLKVFEIYHDKYIFKYMFTNQTLLMLLTFCNVFFKKPPPTGSETIPQGSKFFHGVHGRWAFPPSCTTLFTNRRSPQFFCVYKMIKYHVCNFVNRFYLGCNASVHIFCTAVYISGR